MRPKSPEPGNGVVNEESPILRTASQLQSSSSVATKASELASPSSDTTTVSPFHDDRVILQEQDAALEEALRKDRELLERIREERAQEQERIQRMEEEQRQIIARSQWRRWARRALVPPTATEGGVKFAVRLPSGQRCVGILPKDASLEHVHILAETFLIPDEHSPQDDPEQPPEGYEHQWEFRLVTGYKRMILPNNDGMLIRDDEILQRGVLLILEGIRKKKTPECGIE